MEGEEGGETDKMTNKGMVGKRAYFRVERIVESVDERAERREIRGKRRGGMKS